MGKKRETEDALLPLEDSRRLAKCQCAIDLLLSKLRMINTELSVDLGRDIILTSCGRIKCEESIRAKLMKKGCEVSFESAEERLNDLVGVRAVCSFLDDLYRVADRLAAHKDVKVIKVKDYLKDPKASGYRSLHLIVEVPICFQSGIQWVKAEVQLRTSAMDFWAGLDHKLRYKRGQREAELIGEELKRYAGIIGSVDNKMMELRDKIQSMGE